MSIFESKASNNENYKKIEEFLKKLSPKSRAEMAKEFNELQKLSGGSRNYVPQDIPGGDRLFVVSQGHTLVIDSAGNMFRGLAQNSIQLRTGSAGTLTPNYGQLRPIK